jgi:hypothetical protein
LAEASADSATASESGSVILGESGGGVGSAAERGFVGAFGLSSGLVVPVPSRPPLAACRPRGPGRAGPLSRAIYNDAPRVLVDHGDAQPYDLYFASGSLCPPRAS